MADQTTQNLQAEIAQKNDQITYKDIKQRQRRSQHLDKKYNLIAEGQNSENTQSQKEVGDLKSELNKEKEKVSNQFNLFNNEKNGLNDKIKQLETDLAEILQKRTKECQEQEEIVKVLKTQIQTEKESQTKQLNEFDQEKQNLVAQLQNLNNKINQLEIEENKTSQTKKEEIAEQQIQIASLKEQIKTHSAQLLEKTNQISILQELTENNSVQQESYKLEIENLNSNCQSLEQQVQNLQRRLAQFQNIKTDELFEEDSLFDQQKPMLKDFSTLNEKLQKKTFNRNVSLLGYSEGKTFLLSQLIKKNLTNLSTPDMGIYIHEENIQKDIIFIDTKSLDQPITVDQMNKENENDRLNCKRRTQSINTQGYRKQKIKENLKVDLLTDISDFLIVIVNQITRSEQDLLMKLKKNFGFQNSKKMIVVHNLFRKQVEQIKIYEQNIQYYFNLNKMYKDQEKFYFIEQDNVNILHIILGNQNCEDQQTYFKHPIQIIKEFVVEQIYQDSEPINKSMECFLNNQISYYLEIDKNNKFKDKQQNDQIPDSIYHEQLSKEQQNKSRKKEKSIEDQEEEMKDSQQQDREKAKETPTPSQDFIELDFFNSDYFIFDQQDLLLDQTKYKCVDTKNFTHELQRCQTSQLRYSIEELNEGRILNIYIEVPGQVLSTYSELIPENNELIFIASKEADCQLENLRQNERSFGSIAVKLKYTDFQFYQKIDHSYLNHGVYKIELEQRQQVFRSKKSYR